MSDMRDGGSSGAAAFFAFLAGAIVGVGVGILLAPKSGEETRKDLGDLARKAREKAAEVAGRMRQQSEG